MAQVGPAHAHRLLTEFETAKLRSLLFADVSVRIADHRMYG